MILEEFKTFIASGAITRAGFAIDKNSLVYNNDASGNFESVRGTVLAVEASKLGGGFFNFGAKTAPANRSVVWDTNGKPISDNALFALVKPAS